MKTSIKARNVKTAALLSLSRSTSALQTHTQNQESASNTASDVLARAGAEQRELSELLRLMGWQAIHPCVLLEVMDDLNGYLMELSGEYSSLCPFTRRRRERVDYWVSASIDGICSPETARDALRINRI